MFPDSRLKVALRLLNVFNYITHNLAKRRNVFLPQRHRSLYRDGGPGTLGMEGISCRKELGVACLIKIQVTRTQTRSTTKSRTNLQSHVCSTIHTKAAYDMLLHRWHWGMHVVYSGPHTFSLIAVLQPALDAGNVAGFEPMSFVTDSI